MIQDAIKAVKSMGKKACFAHPFFMAKRLDDEKRAGLNGSLQGIGVPCVRKHLYRAIVMAGRTPLPILLELVPMYPSLSTMLTSFM